MKIDILEAGRFVTLGSGLLRILQNNYTPKGDLLIREAIQNSLDAAKNDTDHIKVKIDIKEFESSSLSNLLEEVGPKLERDFPKTQKMISIRDYNTTGLTGPKVHEQIEGQKFGKFVSLVYDLAKAQENKESGGSWGYGKTIYYRMGIGLVIYYTRIIDEEGEYEERLAIAMVEDETGENTYIPAANDKNTKSGIAWWGDLNEDGKSVPITNEQEIKEVLEIFNISPYSENETGTTIIIPYIDEEEIINSNHVELKNNKNAVDMYVDLETFFKYSVQRWYAPRLNNRQNIFSPKRLEVYVNDQMLIGDELDGYFTLLGDLYNYAAIGDRANLRSGVKKEQLFREEIIVHSSARSTFDQNILGYLSYGLFNYEQVGMGREYDEFNPYYITNNEIENIDEKPVLITFTRRPGMFVNHQIQSDWSRNIYSPNKSEYIVGVFVLNSNVGITFPNDTYETLEEYIRQGEQADHVSWDDHDQYGEKQTIVSRIRNNVRRKLENSFQEEVEERLTSNDGRLGAIAGDLILPPTGFGKQAKKKTARPKPRNNNISRGKNNTTKVYYEKAIYTEEYIELPFEVTLANNGLNEIVIELKIQQEGGAISIPKYEMELNVASPIEIVEVNFVERNKKQENQESLFSDIVTNKTTQNKTWEVSYLGMFNEKDSLTGYMRISNEIRNVLPKIEIKVGGRMDE